VRNASQATSIRSVAAGVNRQSNAPGNSMFHAALVETCVCSFRSASPRLKVAWTRGGVQNRKWHGIEVWEWTGRRQALHVTQSKVASSRKCNLRCRNNGHCYTRVECKEVRQNTNFSKADFQAWFGADSSAHTEARNEGNMLCCIPSKPHKSSKCSVPRAHPAYSAEVLERKTTGSRQP